MSEGWVPLASRPYMIEARLREERNARSAVENIRWRSANPDAVPVGVHRGPVPPQTPEPAPAASSPAPAKVPKIVNRAKPAWAVGLSPEKERAIGAAMLAEERKATRARQPRPRQPQPQPQPQPRHLSGEAQTPTGRRPVRLSAREVERIARRAVGDLR